MIRSKSIARPAFAALVGLAALAGTASATLAQTATLTFDQAAYITCREAHAMPVEQRKAVAAFLADHAARHRGVTMPTDDSRGAQLGYLVRGGCTLYPDAYLLVVIDRAITAEAGKLSKR